MKTKLLVFSLFILILFTFTAHALPSVDMSVIESVSETVSISASSLDEGCFQSEPDGEKLEIHIENPLVSHIPDASGEDGAELFNSSVKNSILSGLKNMYTYIDVSAGNYSVYDYDDLNELQQTFLLVLFENYDLFYVRTTDLLFYYNDYGKIIEIKPSYKFTDPDYIKDTVTEMDRVLDEMILAANSEMNAVQKLLTIHDRLAVDCEYDTSYDESTAYDAAGALIEGKAVCQGYSIALFELAKRLGIKGGFITSNEMGHMWNIFYVDGKWYHVDITWDDPVPDRYGLVLHNYFLKSDAWMRNYGEHYGFTNANATSTKYDKYFWNGVSSPIITVDGKMYYIDGEFGNYALKYRTSSGSEKKIYSFDDKWYTGTGNYYRGPYSGLVLYNGRLYFNTPDKIISTDPDGENVKIIDSPLNSKVYSLYGCFLPTKEKENFLYFSYEDRLVFDYGNGGDGELLVDKTLIPIYVTGIAFDETSVTVNKYQTYTPTLTFYPANATNKNVLWESSNKNVASVDENGNITGASVGFAVITATTKDGGYKARINVTVKEIRVNSVTLDKTAVALVSGDTYLLTATVLPEDASNKDLTWTSSDKTVATVENGLVTAIGNGSCTITVTTLDGSFSDTATVTVNSFAVTGVKFDEKAVSLKVGDTYELKYTVYPENATNKDVTFKTRSSMIATIENGILTAKHKCDLLTVTVTTSDGGFTDEMYVSITPVNVTGISLDKSKAYLEVGESLTLTPTVYPDNATDKDMGWSSEDTSIATVKDGKVTAVKSGKTRIRAKTYDGGYTAYCEITVLPSSVFRIGEKSALPEEQIEIPISLKTDKSFNTIGFEIDFDESVLTYNGYETNRNIKNCILTGSCTELPQGKISASFYTNQISGYDGTLITLKFTVNKTAKAGSYGITGNVCFLSLNIDSYDAEITDSLITVLDRIPGDLTGDDNINLEDAIYLLQYSLFPESYPLEYSGSVDFVHDGCIDLEDAIYLLQHSLFPDTYPLS